MMLTFPREGIEKLLKHTESHSEMANFYGEAVTEPSLFLVGDEGVYLMSAAKVRLKDPEDESRHFVVYANEINPRVLPFDEWWANKRAAFGGDDGVEVYPSASFRRALGTSGDLRINMTPGNLSKDVLGEIEIYPNGASKVAEVLK